MSFLEVVHEGDGSSVFFQWTQRLVPPHVPWFPNNLCNFCQACHSAAIIPNRAHLTQCWTAAGTFFCRSSHEDVPIATLHSPSCQGKQSRLVPLPGPAPRHLVSLFWARRAAAHIWVAASVRNKCTKAVTQMIVPVLVSRIEHSPRWPECSQKPKPYCSLNWDILPVKLITGLCGCHKRNLFLLHAIRESNWTNVTVKASTSVCSATGDMVWRPWCWSVKQGAPQSWRWECFYFVRAPLALTVVSLRQPGSR